MSGRCLTLGFVPLVRSVSRARARWSAVAAQCRRGLLALADPYRPEAHYMRGPGPKWHAKHGGTGSPG